MGQSREKQFAKNTLILSIGTLGSKIFTFLLLPLYTAVLATEDYGNVDVLQTVIQLAVPIITLQLSNAVFRFIIEQKTLAGKKEIVTNAVFVVVLNTAIGVAVIIGINLIWPIPYCVIFIACFITTAIFRITQCVVRGLGHNGLYSFTGFVAVLISLGVNLILILGFGLKGDSILIALAVSNAMASVIMILKERMWQYISIETLNKNKIKEMLKYSLPLIPNEISWWIVNSSDRFLILYYLGAGFNGIYAAANKIPGIYSTVFSVFNIAWAESVVRNINDKDREDFINGMLAKFYKLFTCICIGIICSISVLFSLLIGVNYANAYNHIYILTLAIFFHSMCALYGSIFGAFKQSKIIGTTTIVGAIANIVINFALINVIGLYAASISTLVSYFLVFLVRVIKVNKLVKLKWPMWFLLRASGFLSIVSVGYFLRNDYLNIFILIVLVFWSFVENKKVLIGFMKTGLAKIKK